mmetsp:Transcript_53234/g.165020  ORF Transcript_53234/g.165020 Transcript_53234/m.165020 type:complete len:249 (+) Transcript_53234:227-973(+)
MKHGQTPIGCGMERCCPSSVSRLHLAAAAASQHGGLMAGHRGEAVDDAATAAAHLALLVLAGASAPLQPGAPRHRRRRRQPRRRRGARASAGHPQVSVEVGRVAVHGRQALPDDRRVEEGGVHAEEEELVLVPQHDLEDGIPKEYGQLAVAHDLVQLDDTLVGQLRGGAVEEVAYDVHVLDDLHVGQEGLELIRLESSVRRALAVQPLLHLLEVRQALAELVVAVGRDHGVGLLVKRRHDPSVQDADL